jgi:ABC-type nitrate/sulfonate/bicarbonate transport system substrate-binding protein
MKNGRNKIVAALIVIALVGTSAWLYARHKNRRDENVIRLFDSTVGTEFEIAQVLTGRDFLREEGVHLKKTISVDNSGGTVAIQALVANNVDYAGSAYTAWINAIARGAKITAVVNMAASSKINPGNGLVVLADSGIHSIKDVADKRIGVNVLGALSDYEIRDLLRTNGMTIDQVQLVVVPSRNIEQALRSHQIDAAAWTMNGGPDFENTIARGGVYEVPSTRRFDLHGSVVTYGSGFRNDFIQKHPQAVIHFINALERSRRVIWDAYVKDPLSMRKAYAEVTERKGGNPALARFYKPNYATDHLYANDQDLQVWIDCLAADGKIKSGQVKPSDIYTHKYNQFYPADKAQPERGL